MRKINVKGSIVNDADAGFYRWLRIPCASAADFKQALTEAAGDDVVVEINSPGGYVAPAAEIYEAIRQYQGNIECHVVGQAASAASIIACAAPSAISPMGTFFMHNCIGSTSGNHNDMRQAMQAMESIDENIMEAYRAKTGMSDEDIYHLMEENTTLNARQAVEYGFIDRITEAASDAAQSASAATGIAASADGFIDLMAMDAGHLASIRELYEKDMRASCEGGENMEREDIKDAEDQAIDAVDEETAEEPEEPEAETAEESEAEAVEGEEQFEETAEEPEADSEVSEADAGEAQDAYERGVLAERERIAAIMGIANRVPDSMLQAALFTEPISAEQLALQAMRAEDGVRAGYMDKARADAEASKSAEVAADVSDTTGESVKDQQKRMLAEALDKKSSK